MDPDKAAGLASWLAESAADAPVGLGLATASAKVQEGADAAAGTLLRAATAEDMFDLAAAPVKVVVARFVSADGTSKPLDFCAGEGIIKLGRSKDLPLSHRLDCSRLSAFHCEVHIATATNVVSIVDTSTNGVWVNGTRIAKGVAIELNSGDTVRLLNPAAATAASDSGATAPSMEFLFQQVKAKTTVKSLEDELTCSVCRSVYYKPVTAIPCLHTFCGHCLSQWLEGPIKHTDCPECRTKVKEARPSHKLSSLVDELLKSCPHLARSAEDKADCDKANTIPPVGKVYGKRDRDGDDLDRGDDDGSDEDYDEDDDGDDDSGSDHGPAFAHWAPAAVPFKLPMFFSAAPTSCPQCSTPAPDGFMCPPHGPHLRCLCCKTPFPHRPLCTVPQQCDLCNKAFCDLYLGGCRNPGGVGYLQPVADHVIKELPLGSLFLGNTVEQGILMRYLDVMKVDIATLWALCVEKLKSGEWVPDLTCVKGPIANATVCRPCAQRVFSAQLYHFRRAIPRDSMPPEVAARPDCWYGLQCRTMQHNTTHAQAYNHVCPNVKRKE